MGYRGGGKGGRNPGGGGDNQWYSTDPLTAFVDQRKKMKDARMSMIELIGKKTKDSSDSDSSNKVGRISNHQAKKLTKALKK